MSKSKVYKQHYDPSFIMNAKDALGNEPTWRIVCSLERGPGKTYGFSKILITNYLEKGEQFVLLTRKIGDLGSVAKGILTPYLEGEHPDMSIRELVHQSKVYSQIYLDVKNGDKVDSHMVGFVLPIKQSDAIKKISGLFNHVSVMFFDEFMPSADSSYLTDEVGLLMNLYKSVARGGGKAVRELPIIMCSNTLSLGNPYFEALDLNNKIQENTRFYQGENRVVFERCEVEGLSKMHSESGLDVSLKKYIDRNRSNVWINDDSTLVSKKKDREWWGRPRYVCTLVYQDEKIGMYKYDKVGYTFLSRNFEAGCKYIYCLEIDGTPNIPLFKTSALMDQLKRDFFKGTVRVSDSMLQKMLMDVFG